MGIWYDVGGITFALPSEGFETPVKSGRDMVKIYDVKRG